MPIMFANIAIFSENALLFFEKEHPAHPPTVTETTASATKRPKPTTENTGRKTPQSHPLQPTEVQ